MSSESWIGLSQATGTVADGSSMDAVVSADVTGLGVGTYNGTITISDPTVSSRGIYLPLLKSRQIHRRSAHQ